ncbi:MAG: primosomal replication protein N [Pseudomonadota bacterium]
MIEGEVVGIEPLRYTPAGIPVLSVVLRHLSEQLEAGMQRRVECDVNAVVMGGLAEKTADPSLGIKLGSVVKVSGFIARRSLKSTQLVLHITTLDII